MKSSENGKHEQIQQLLDIGSQGQDRTLQLFSGVAHISLTKQIHEKWCMVKYIRDKNVGNGFVSQQSGVPSQFMLTQDQMNHIYKRIERIV